MKIKWPTGFGGGKTFNVKPQDLWSEQEVVESGFPKLLLKPPGHKVMATLIDCKRMSVTQVLTKEQQADRANHIHVELPRDFKHYLVVRLDTNTAVKWDAKFKRREDPMGGR